MLLRSSRGAAEVRAEVLDEDLPPPRYTLAMNIEIMFPGGMPHAQRIAEVAGCGAKHYGFWDYVGKDLDAMLEAQHKHGLTCVSMTGAPKTGWSTGLTKSGEEAAFLEDFEGACAAARRFGAENLITFVGRIQPEIPWETQRAQIIAGLKKAGPIAEKYGVYLTLEPLNRVESPQMAMITARDAFDFAAEAGHPRVKVDFDIYHRQLGEGNVTSMLTEGLQAGHIHFVEVGAVPGRKEPGTGELDYRFVFNRLRQLGYSGAIGMEHGTTQTPQYAWETVRRLAGLA
ncbi:TIM barrel protein [Planctomyces sp. SH-PL62]|uniref:TIM barrel protein n=1 Tax=Planctomyces sp. SH-PL62 TaxID=1636152 RepID=UPI0018D42A38|nr:TIM barrel protein [Planctomyces sp. SH-PL62]